MKFSSSSDAADENFPRTENYLQGILRAKKRRSTRARFVVPNIVFFRGVIGAESWVRWHVPVDDNSHVEFTLRFEESSISDASLSPAVRCSKRWIRVELRRIFEDRCRLRSGQQAAKIDDDFLDVVEGVPARRAAEMGRNDDVGEYDQRIVAARPALHRKYRVQIHPAGPNASASHNASRST